MARTAYPTLYDATHPTLGLPVDKHRLLAAFYDHGAAALDELIAAGILDLEPVAYPDYYADIAEDEAPNGRVVQPTFPAGWRRGIDPTGGQYLVDQLAAGAERLGVETRLGHHVVHVVRAGDALGAEVRVGRRTELLGARQGIVFCSGGFLHNQHLALEYLRGPVLGGAAAEGATGDFVDIGVELGAQLGNMSHAWWDQVVVELAVRVRATIRDVYSPFGDAMVMVNKYGRRVVNEKAPYNERGQVHFHWDAGRHEYPNYVLLMLFDDAVANSTEQSRFRFPVPQPGDHPDYVISAPTWNELSAAVRARLARLAPFTGGVTLDASFDRGARGHHRPVRRATRERATTSTSVAAQTPIEQAWAGAARNGVPSGTMHPFATEGPYHCVIVGPGALDTKGGPVIDECARVLSPSGDADPGLVRRRQLHRLAGRAGLLGPGRHDRSGLRLRLHRRPHREPRAAPRPELSIRHDPNAEKRRRSIARCRGAGHSSGSNRAWTAMPCTAVRRSAASASASVSLDSWPPAAAFSITAPRKRRVERTRRRCSSVKSRSETAMPQNANQTAQSARLAPSIGSSASAQASGSSPSSARTAASRWRARCAALRYTSRSSSRLSEK